MANPRFMHSLPLQRFNDFNESRASELINESDEMDMVDIDDTNVYYVEKILKYRFNEESCLFEYFVQWLDCPPAFCSWEEEGNILDKDLISEFWQEQQQKVTLLGDYEMKLKQLMDGISRISEAMMDDNVLERIDQIIKELPITIDRRKIHHVDR